MPEALKAVMDYLFDVVGLNRIAACHDVNNPRSGRVMDKAGMKQEGILRAAGKNNLGICDEVWHATIREDRKRSGTHEGKLLITYEKLTEDRLDTFIQMRIRQLREEGATEDIDLVPALQDYYNRHMSDGTFVSWLAMDGDRIVGTSGMSFVEKPPYFGCPSGKMGILSSMFTDLEYRRKGIAKELLSRVVEEARAYGCGTVQITASDMGVLLYTDFGFVKNGNFMQYKL